MSGGVDSSVAAAIRRDQGCEVIGVTLRLRSGIDGDAACASPEDEGHAVDAARQLGIEHRFLDLSDDFIASVLRPSWDEFARGRTPNPCTFCNPRIKFGKLLEYAENIGATEMVTGHYASIIDNNGIFQLLRGDDPAKDQTYFLFALPQTMLRRVGFPLGSMNKSQVREMARLAGLSNASKKDSQDTCFKIPGESFQESLRKLFASACRKGKFISTGGAVLGEHQGLHNYTIGQRKGLNLPMGVPAYVKSIDAASGNIVVTTNGDDLITTRFTVDQVNWQSGVVPPSPFRAMVQIRYRSRPQSATITPVGDGSASVEFDEGQRAVTPGQAAVFYESEAMLGGGYIQDLLI